MKQGSSRLAETVARRAQLEDAEEANAIVGAVAVAMAAHFDREAWNVIRKRVPLDHVDGGDGGDPAGSVKDFFTDLGDREEIGGSAPAARYARIVAEAIREEMSDAEVEQLREALSDDFLALFEVDERGEMTGAPGEREGSRRLGDVDGEQPESPPI